MGAHPGVQRDAAAAGAMGVDDLADPAFDAGLGQRLDDEVALPGAIVRGVPVLDRAAAADAEMRTKRRDPFRACAFDLKQAPAVGMMAGDRRDLDRFARQRVRHVNLLPLGKCDAIAKMTDMIDEEMFSHGARR